MSDMSDAMVGGVATWKGLTLDARYAYFTTAPEMREPVHEFGVKATGDLASLLEKPGSISVPAPIRRAVHREHLPA